MKIAIAAALTGLGLLAAATAPASAESSYWQERWQNPRSTPEYKYHDRREKAWRARRDHVAISIRKRARPDDDGYFYESAPRSYNGPVAQSQEQVQQSVYDFATGGSGAIDKWR